LAAGIMAYLRLKTPTNVKNYIYEQKQSANLGEQ
jgi:hypothetical protein